nr:RNA-directed DNA polymerase, eukaryota, reverse transcriptase zinc-binding domain protein [Tanacetum cinerariifolium]
MNGNPSKVNIKQLCCRKIVTILLTLTVLSALRRSGNENKQDSCKLAWVKWLNVLASQDKGGLGIGSLRSFNLALLQKWRRRFISNANALWVKVIKSFHGQEGGFDLNVSPSSGIWSKIMGSLISFIQTRFFLMNPSNFMLEVVLLFAFGKIYGLGKENEANILKSIDEWPYKMGTVRETLAESTEGAPQFGLPKDIYTLINHYTDAKDIWDNVKMLLEGFELTKEDRESQLYDDFEHFRQHKRESIHDYYVRGLRDSNYDQLYAYLKQHKTHAKENKMILERFSQPTVDPLALLSNVSNSQQYLPSSLASSSTQVPPPLADSSSPAEDLIENLTNTLNRVGNVNQGQARPGQARTMKCYNCIDNVFQADDCDAFDSNVDEAPTAQTMFMANLSSADPVTDKTGPSYDFDILSEVQEHNRYMDDVFAHHEEHVMHDSVQLNHVVDSHADYTSDSNMIPYVMNNEVLVVHNNVSSVTNDAFMMIYNDMCEPPAQSVSNPSRNT